MPSKFVVLKPVSISRGILPVDRELQPGDFGFSESHLQEMAAKGQVREDKPARRKKEDDSE